MFEFTHTGGLAQCLNSSVVMAVLWGKAARTTEADLANHCDGVVISKGYTQVMTAKENTVVQAGEQHWSKYAGFLADNGSPSGY